MCDNIICLGSSCSVKGTVQVYTDKYGNVVD